jgi:hypothetical protein
VEVRRLGIQETEGFGGGGDASRNEQLGENQRETGLAGEGIRKFVVGFGEKPALGRQSASCSGIFLGPGGTGGKGH